MYDAKWALLAPILILGGIYGGLVTVTEASIIAVIYPVLVGLFITRRLSLKSFQDSLFYTGKIVGTVLIILTTGTLFGKILAMNQIPQRIAEYLVSTFQSPVVLLLLVNVLLLFVGMWMETITQIIILTPLLLPVVVSAGIDPIQFGVMFVVVCEIGYETPPLGVNLFVAQEISDCSIEAISKEAIPFALAEFAALMIITFVPQLTLFLPSLL
jgi:C4-dicarboxylate transporter DctM subunit